MTRLDLGTAVATAEVNEAANGHRADAARERTTWWPTPFSTTPVIPEPPTLLTRADGLALLYSGRVNALVGESEAMKTWAAYVAAVECILAGGHVLLVDFEDVANTACERLTALGLTCSQLCDQVHFLHPEEPLLDRHDRATPTMADLVEILDTWPIGLAVFDGVTEGMGLEGLEPLDNADVARWYRHGPRRVAAAGAATVVLDHVTKSREDRGRYALGGVHKLNGLDGAGYTLDAVEPFAPGHTGIVRITVAKDRPGFVRAQATDRKHVGRLTLISSTDGNTITSSFAAPDQPAADFEPTHYMEKISRHLELYDRETKTELRRLGKAEYIDTAISRLVANGNLTIEPDGNAHRHHIVTPYREHPDDH